MLLSYYLHVQAYRLLESDLNFEERKGSFERGYKLKNVDLCWYPPLSKSPFQRHLNFLQFLRNTFGIIQESYPVYNQRRILYWLCLRNATRPKGLEMHYLKSLLTCLSILLAILRNCKKGPFPSFGLVFRMKQHLTKLYYPLFLTVGQSRVLNLQVRFGQVTHYTH